MLYHFKWPKRNLPRDAMQSCCYKNVVAVKSHNHTSLQGLRYQKHHENGNEVTCCITSQIAQESVLTLMQSYAHCQHPSTMPHKVHNSPFTPSHRAFSCLCLHGSLKALFLCWFESPRITVSLLPSQEIMIHEQELILCDLVEFMNVVADTDAIDHPQRLELDTVKTWTLPELAENFFPVSQTAQRSKQQT